MVDIYGLILGVNPLKMKKLQQSWRQRRELKWKLEIRLLLPFLLFLISLCPAVPLCCELGRGLAHDNDKKKKKKKEETNRNKNCIIVRFCEFSSIKLECRKRRVKNYTHTSMASPSLSVPYALLPSLQQTHLIDDDDDPITVDRSIFSLSEKKLYEWKNILKGHVGAWCIGSSHGWIVLLDQNGVPFLLNSSSSTTINVPPIPLSFLHPVTYSYFTEYLRKTFIVKAILMCCASPSSYILAIIYGSNYKIAYCNSATWVELSHDKQSYCDIVFSNNYLYALTQDGFVEVWNICGQIPKRLILLTPTVEANYEEEKSYLEDNFSRNLYLVVCRRNLTGDKIYWEFCE
ncbi:putative F-box protein At5g55150 [Arachis hypogaea]|uniref:KIB1-4 beta-propeller domain-containing protein n=2 Tax=Arachis hypogaea TaxID=3818 RepID=A0A6B9V4Q2_ARAHY|nr:uncharacterized protein DS421_19g644030 [Arachis hypogaea]